MNSDSAWITGIGVVGPQGHGWQTLCESLRAPSACFQSVPADWLGYPGAPDAFIAPLDPQAEQAVLPHQSLSTDRACALALCAAAEAWTQSAPQVDPRRAGVYWGTGMGGLHTTETSYQRLLTERAPLRPMTVVRIMANSAAAQLAIQYGLKGPNQTYSVACASSATALGEALLALRAGRIDLALVGGSEAMLVPGVLAAWGALRVLSTRKTVKDPALACRPFSSERAGLAIGEGAAAFVLESERHARARGARPLAELAGYGTSCDATSLVHPQMDGQVEAMRQALQDAGLTARDISAVNAHATGTDAGDVAEAQALAATFGPGGPPVSATKSQHGHLLGAVGALEAAISVASLQLQLVPATLGVQPIDPRCAGLDVSGQPRAMPLEHVLSNSFAFGGTNVSLVLRRAAASSPH
ncbi:MAG: beta-ketoacyl-[acyl-carrier-protein] synthase family protein [Ramlibacter sp.]|nr:beta-ketoacyl-[acyl-carrier-protein] synthase family protein [Ramlibacter sp.]